MPVACFRGLIQALALVVSATAATAEPVGFALDVRPGAVIETAGRQQPVRPRDEISAGDVIRTNATGTLQLVFRDRTRVVVGPDSRFVVTDVRIRRNRAEAFAVTATSGTFRFLSGRSPKEAYEIRTPTATMGIRGTVFDFAVSRGRATALVTFAGQVRICGTRRQCALVSGGCATVQTTRAGGVAQPATRTDRDALIRSDFPFIVSQRDLPLRFRTRTGSCGTVALVPVRKQDVPPPRVIAPSPQETVVEPPAPEPPAPEPPAPEPPAPSSDFPGQSGVNAPPGPSQGIGHERSREAGGLGKGHGKENPNKGGNGRASR